MPFYVYILQSEKDQRFYFGQTQNIEKRIIEHNTGKSTYTQKFIPWNLYAYKSCDSRKEAMKFERMLKNLHNQEKVLQFIGRHYFTVSK